MTDYERTTQGAITFYDDSSAQFRLLWTISNFLEVQERIVKSPNYIELKESVTVIPGKYNCGLKLYPNGDSESPSSISVFLTNEGPNNAWVDFQVSVLDENFRQQHIKSECRKPLIKPGTSWGWIKWFPAGSVGTEANTLLPNGCLQVLVIGTVSTNEQERLLTPKVGNVQKTINVPFDVSFSTRSDQGDTVLSVNEEKFQVHKCVLSKRSSVFDDLFKTQSSEYLVIPEISTDAFRHILQFIYTDSVTAAIDTVLPEVLKAADKYKLDYLKDICQIKMLRYISVSNAVDYLRVAEETNAFQIKEKALDFIVENKSEVSQEDTWRAFRSERSELLVELLDRLMI